MSAQLYWNIFSTLFGFVLIIGATLYEAFKAKLSARKAKGDTAAYVLDAVGSMAEKLVFQAQVSGLDNTNKKKYVSQEIQQTLGKLGLPNPGSQVIDGAVEQAVVSMKTAQGLVQAPKQAVVEIDPAKDMEQATPQIQNSSIEPVGDLNA